MLKQLTSPQAKKLAEQVGEPFKKAPHLPESVTEFLVKITPYLAIIGGVLTVLGALQTLSIPMGWSTTSRFLQMFGVVNPVYWWIIGLISLASGALLIMAYQPLKDRKFAGWMYMFWLEVLSIIQMLVGVVMVGTSVVGAVLAILIGFYILYEVKPHYGMTKKLV
jgi:hypothetical protein